MWPLNLLICEAGIAVFCQQYVFICAHTVLKCRVKAALLKRAPELQSEI